MFYSEEAQHQYEDDLAQDAMSQGEYMSAALSQYTGAYGAEDVNREWILSPYDTWEKNPHYVGKPGRHPEDDFDDEEDLPAYTVRRLARRDAAAVLEPEWDDVIPF